MSATVVTERLTIYRDPNPRQTATFAQDVRAGLSESAKRLPPKYFYDDLGSSLFEAITRLPEYYLTRIERDLLYGYAGEIVERAGTPLELLELGSGSAQKTRLLIDAVLERQPSLVYRPIDISPEALVESSLGLVKAHPRLEVHAYAGDYFSLLDHVRLDRNGRILALFLGSNIGNFEPREAERLLTLLARALRRGDMLLVGFDLKKEPEILELAYDDPTGVTAAFDRNILGRINRELGGDFDLHNFAHVARYDEERGAVDSFLQARAACEVTIASLGLRVAIDAGERIHTESSYKFTHQEIEAIAARCGYAPVRRWSDQLERYGLELFTVL